MADKYAQAEVGECLKEIAAISCKCAAAVTKGQVVEVSAEQSGDLPTITPGTAAATNVVGVALATGAVGDTIAVLIIGIVKVTAAGAITVGERVRAGATGKVDAMPGTPAAGDEKQMIGIALHTAAADGDTILIFVGVI